jgi:hypothetical protein
MIPESELARALARWKARKLGLATPANDTGEDVPVPVFEEATRVASNQYQSEMVTPQAEVQLSDGDYEDHTKTRSR